MRIRDVFADILALVFLVGGIYILTLLAYGFGWN
jgi:hypothetical protein